MFSSLRRIAIALETRVVQHEDTVRRNLEIREENIRNYEERYASELAEAREMNAQLIARLDTALATQAKLLARREEEDLVVVTRHEEGK